ncbi:hypothetical protein Tco_1260895, partial [Tanacetum coccineum]
DFLVVKGHCRSAYAPLENRMQHRSEILATESWQIGNVMVLDIKDIRIHTIVLDIDINGTNTQSRNVPTSRGSHILQNKEDIYCLEDYTAQESSISQDLVRTLKAKTRRRLKILSNQSMRLMIMNNSRKEGRYAAKPFK